MYCLWSKNTYLAASRQKNNENIERTFKSRVSVSYTGIFYLINIIVGSEKVLDLSIFFIIFSWIIFFLSFTMAKLGMAKINICNFKFCYNRRKHFQIGSEKRLWIWAFLSSFSLEWSFFFLSCFTWPSRAPPFWHLHFARSLWGCLWLHIRVPRIMQFLF